jgi:hypothetical protein
MAKIPPLAYAFIVLLITILIATAFPPVKQTMLDLIQATTK